MKTKITLLILFLTFLGFAQNNTINYKALVKDNLGNIVSSQPVNIRFTIYSDAIQVYQEVQTTNTDANGLVTVDIGSGGVTSDVFTAIKWHEGLHSLQTEIDITGTATSFVGLGTTDFKSVPYALNGPGLFQVYNGTDQGWRLEKNPILEGGNIADIGEFAVDMTFHNDNVWEASGASGIYSFAANKDNLANGYASSAFGDGTQASGFTSAAFNEGNWAAGYASFAMGSVNEVAGTASLVGGTESYVEGNNSFGFGLEVDVLGNNSHASGFDINVSGDNSQAFGSGLLVSVDNAMAIGRLNIDETNAVFMVGNGVPGTRSNAITVLKNGTITAPSLTNTLINTAGDKALVTKEYVDIFGNMGLYEVSDSGNMGWRLEKNPMPTNGASVAPIGEFAVDMTYHNDNEWFTTGASGEDSFAANRNNWASGFASSVFGDGNQASGSASSAFGEGNWASGFYSFATGSVNEVSGNASIVGGTENFVEGNNSFAMGLEVNVLGNSSQAMGEFINVSGDKSQAFGSGLIVSEDEAIAVGRLNIDETNAVFMVGNGIPGTRSNAITVLKNGNIGLGDVTQPDEQLHLNGTIALNNSRLRGFLSGDFAISTDDDVLKVGYFDSFNEWGPGNTNTVSLGSSGFRWSEVWSVNPLNTSSDRRLKKDINPINYGLETVMNLKPVSYKWKQGKQDTKLGFIAQDVASVIPEIVKQEKISADKKAQLQKSGREIPKEDYYAMSYTELIPILAKAIQELKSENDNLKQRIEQLENKD